MKGTLVGQESWGSGAVALAGGEQLLAGDGGTEAATEGSREPSG